MNVTNVVGSLRGGIFGLCNMCWIWMSPMLETGFAATCNFERLDSRVKFSYEKEVYYIIENTVLDFFKLGA